MNSKYFILLLVFLAFALSVSAADWTQFMANAAHSGSNGDLGPISNLIGINQYEINGMTDNHLVIFGNYVFLAGNKDDGSYLYAFNKNNGEEIKNCKLSSARIVGSLAVYVPGERIYLPLSDDIFQVNTILNPNSWAATCPGLNLNTGLQLTSSIIIEGNYAYFGSATGVHKLDLNTKMTTSYLVLGGVNTPTISKGANSDFLVFAVGSGNNRGVYSVNANTMAISGSPIILNADTLSSPAVLSEISLGQLGYNLVVLPTLSDTNGNGHIYFIEQDRSSGVLFSANSLYGSNPSDFIVNGETFIGSALITKTASSGFIYLASDSKLYRGSFYLEPNQKNHHIVFALSSTTGTPTASISPSLSSPILGSDGKIYLFTTTGFYIFNGGVHSYDWENVVGSKTFSNNLLLSETPFSFALSEGKLYSSIDNSLMIVTDVLPDCTPATCDSLDKNCGSVSDGCGNSLSCGVCVEGKECRNNVCVENAPTVPQPEVPPSVPPASTPLYGDYNNDGFINIEDWVEIRANPAAFWQAMGQDLINLNNYLVAMKNGWKR